MSLAKIQYEATPASEPKGDRVKSIILKEADRLSTGTLVWLLMTRHKFGLVMLYALIVSVLYLTPWLPGMVFSLFFR